MNKNIILRAGLYNLFNRKYHTWDTLRGINKISTTDSVDKEGKGLERFYAPGRNFAASMRFVFKLITSLVKKGEHHVRPFIYSFILYLKRIFQTLICSAGFAFMLKFI